MIILAHPKRFGDYRHAFDDDQLAQFWKDAGVPEGTPVLFDINLPLEDEEGNPIFCFVVKNNEARYWRGEPLMAEPVIK